MGDAQDAVVTSRRARGGRRRRGRQRGRHAGPARRNAVAVFVDTVLGLGTIPFYAAAIAALVRLLVGSAYPESGYAGIACPGGAVGLGYVGALTLGVVLPILLLAVAIGGSVRAIAHQKVAWPWALLPTGLAGTGVVLAQVLWPQCAY